MERGHRVTQIRNCNDKKDEEASSSKLVSGGVRVRIGLDWRLAGFRMFIKKPKLVVSE